MRVWFLKLTNQLVSQIITGVSLKQNNETINFHFVIPVKDGGRYFEKCILSICQQDYINTQIHILDNGLKDEELNWLDVLAKNYSITVYKKPPRVLSIEENWSRIIDLDLDGLVTCAGRDDLFKPTYASKMLELHLANPVCSIYYSNFFLIDPSDEVISTVKIQKTETLVDFVMGRLNLTRLSFGTGYAFNWKRFETCRGFQPFPKLLFADDALIVSCLLDGSQIDSCNETLFCYRVHKSSESYNPSTEDFFKSMALYFNFLLKKEILLNGPIEIRHFANFLNYYRYYYFFRYGASLKLTANVIKTHICDHKHLKAIKLYSTFNLIGLVRFCVMFFSKKLRKFIFVK